MFGVVIKQFLSLRRIRVGVFGVGFVPLGVFDIQFGRVLIANLFRECPNFDVVRRTDIDGLTVGRIAFQQRPVGSNVSRSWWFVAIEIPKTC